MKQSVWFVVVLALTGCAESGSPGDGSDAGAVFGDAGGLEPNDAGPEFPPETQDTFCGAFVPCKQPNTPSFEDDYSACLEWSDDWWVQSEVDTCGPKGDPDDQCAWVDCVIAVWMQD